MAAGLSVREVGPQRLLECLGGLVIDHLGLAHELLELGPHNVHIDRDAGILERQKANPEGAFDQVDAAGGRSLGQESGQPCVPDDGALDDDRVAVDANPSYRPDLGGSGRLALAAAKEDGEWRANRGFHV